MTAVGGALLERTFVSQPECGVPARPEVQGLLCLLQGMEGIRKVFIREAKRTTVEPGGGAYKTENEWMLDTEGACFCPHTSVSINPPRIDLHNADVLCACSWAG